MRIDKKLNGWWDCKCEREKERDNVCVHGRDQKPQNVRGRVFWKCLIPKSAWFQSQFSFHFSTLQGSLTSTVTTPPVATRSPSINARSPMDIYIQTHICVHTSTHLGVAKYYFFSNPNSTLFLSMKSSQLPSPENSIFLNCIYFTSLSTLLIYLNPFCAWSRVSLSFLRLPMWDSSQSLFQRPKHSEQHNLLRFIVCCCTCLLHGWSQLPGQVYQQEITTILKMKQQSEGIALESRSSDLSSCLCGPFPGAPTMHGILDPGVVVVLKPNISWFQSDSRGDMFISSYSHSQVGARVPRDGPLCLIQAYQEYPFSD